MKLGRWGRLLVFTSFAVTTFTGASWPLQPLVEVRISRVNAVPQGCDESLAPAAAPRLEVKQIPAPEPLLAVAPAAPPSRSLRSELQAAHRALASNDRPAFDEHLRTGRSILGSYPPGGERTAAEEVLRVLEDASRVWDAQFQSPFFDERSDVYARLNRYPGYSDAVRRSMLTDDEDRRYYPAGESREFLTRIAADRLPRLGAMPETRTARTEPSSPTLRPSEARDPARVVVTPGRDRPASPPKQASVPKLAEKTTLRPRSSAPPRSRVSRKATTPARSTPVAGRSAQRKAVTEPKSPVKSAPIPRTAVTAPPPGKDNASAAVPTGTYATTGSAVPVPTSSGKRSSRQSQTRALAPASASAPTQTAASPAPVATESAVPVTSMATETTSTVVTETSTASRSSQGSATALSTTDTATYAPTTETVAPEITETSATTAVAEPERRSILVPVLLILIGLGVLILLFRAGN